MFEALNWIVGNFNSIPVFASITGLSAWGGSVWRDRKNVEDKRRTDIEMEQLKTKHAQQTQTLEHALQIERHATQLGRAKLLEKQVLIIDHNYKLLVSLQRAIYDTFRPDYFGRERPSMQEAYEAALPKFDLFVMHFEENKIYFTENTSDIMSRFYVTAAKALDQSRTAMQSGESWGSENPLWLQKLFDTVEYDMQAVKKSIEHDLRHLMYVPVS